MTNDVPVVSTEERHEALWRLVRDPNTSFARLLDATEGGHAFSTDRPDEAAFVVALFGHPGLTVEGLVTLLRRGFHSRTTPAPPTGWDQALVANPAIPLFFLENPSWLSRLGHDHGMALAGSTVCARAWFLPLWEALEDKRNSWEGWRTLVEGVNLEPASVIWKKYMDRWWLSVIGGLFFPTQPLADWWVRDGIAAVVRGEDLTHHRHYEWCLAPKEEAK